MVVIKRLNMAGNQVQAIKPIMATSILSTDNPSYYLFYKNRWKSNPNNMDCDNENLKCRVTIQITQMRWKCQNRRFESHSNYRKLDELNLKWFFIDRWVSKPSNNYFTTSIFFLQKCDVIYVDLRSTHDGGRVIIRKVIPMKDCLDVMSL